MTAVYHFRLFKLWELHLLLQDWKPLLSVDYQDNQGASVPLGILVRCLPIFSKESLPLSQNLTLTPQADLIFKIFLKSSEY